MNYDAPPKIVGTFTLPIPKVRQAPDDGTEETISIVGIDQEGQLWGLVERGEGFDRWISFELPAQFMNPDEEHFDGERGEWFEVEDQTPEEAEPSGT